MMDVEDEHNRMRAALAYVTGLVNQELLLQNEYLAAENRILKARLQPGWRLSDGERATLAEIGKRLGRKGLEQVARLAKPDTVPGVQSSSSGLVTNEGEDECQSFIRAYPIPNGTASTM
jgi:hypothetical protein